MTVNPFSTTQQARRHTGRPHCANRPATTTIGPYRGRGRRLVAVGVLVGLATLGLGTAAFAATDNPVTINAAADPAAAKTAMDQLPTATDPHFTPTGTPSYDQSSWMLASNSSVNNPPDAKNDAGKDVTISHDATSTWSLGGSVEGGGGLSAFNLANAEVNVKFTANHEWTNETKDAETIYAIAKPGKVVWVVASHSQVTFTGDYTFTANGTNYQVTNVTLTEPAPLPLNEGTDPQAGITYAVVEQPYKAVHPAGTAQPTGLVSLANTPSLTTFTHHLTQLRPQH